VKVFLKVGVSGAREAAARGDVAVVIDALRARLDEARDFILRRGERSTIVLLCAQARWLYQQQGQSIRISELQPEGIVMLDVSQVPLRPNDNLLGMHFAIIGFDGGERAKAL
jgi:hypothetical protein